MYLLVGIMILSIVWSSGITPSLAYFITIVFTPLYSIFTMISWRSLYHSSSIRQCFGKRNYILILKEKQKMQTPPKKMKKAD